jgi:hypothetical protein
MFHRSLWLLQERWDLFFIHVFDTRRKRSEQWRADCLKPAGSYSQIVAVKREVSPYPEAFLDTSTDRPRNPILETATGSINFGTRQHASFQYLKWSSKRLQAVMGRSSVRDF